MLHGCCTVVCWVGRQERGATRHVFLSVTIERRGEPCRAERLGGPYWKKWRLLANCGWVGCVNVNYSFFEPLYATPHSQTQYPDGLSLSLSLSSLRSFAPSLVRRYPLDGVEDTLLSQLTSRDTYDRRGQCRFGPSKIYDLSRSGWRWCRGGRPLA